MTNKHNLGGDVLFLSVDNNFLQLILFDQMSVALGGLMPGEPHLLTPRLRQQSDQD